MTAALMNGYTETEEQAFERYFRRSGLHFVLETTTEAEADELHRLVDEANSNPAMIAYAMEREMQAPEREEAEAGEVAQWLGSAESGSDGPEWGGGAWFAGIDPIEF